MTPLVQARRYLHVAYNCTDGEAEAAAFVEQLGLQIVMRSRSRTDGTQMGFPGEVEADTRFLYDARGPRAGPGIEVQEWIDPPPEGEPYPERHSVGLHAIGIACDRDIGGQDPRSRGHNGELPVDLVEDAALAPGETRLHHLRMTCSDLARSTEWYEAIGFTADGRTTTDAYVGATLHLPDDDFALVLEQWLDPPSSGDPYPTGSHRGLYRSAVAVDDTRAAYDTLSREGFEFTSEPRVVGLPGTNVPDLVIAFLIDPDGVPVELVERPRKAFRR